MPKDRERQGPNADKVTFVGWYQKILDDLRGFGYWLPTGNSSS